MVTEGEIYERLKSEVPNVASLVWHGDVDGQRTLTPKLLENLGKPHAIQFLISQNTTNWSSTKWAGRVQNTTTSITSSPLYTK